MIEKKSYCDKIEFVPPFAVQCRKRISVIENNQELAASFERCVMHPDTDWSDRDDNVQAVCNAVFTDEIKQQWADKLAADAAANQPAEPPTEE